MKDIKIPPVYLLIPKKKKKNNFCPRVNESDHRTLGPDFVKRPESEGVSRS